MGDKHLGPIVFDSLDRPNATPYKDISKPSNRLDWRVIASILFFSTILIIGLFVYVIKALHYRAEYGDDFANILLVALNIAVIFAIIGILAGGVYTAIQWLLSWARMKAMLRLHDGPHYNVFDTRIKNYDDMFERLSARMYDILEERARQSQYQGVSTLTKDESKHIHMKKDGKDIPEQDIDGSDIPITFALNEEGTHNDAGSS